MEGSRAGGWVGKARKQRSEEPSRASLPLRITRTCLTWPGKRGQPGPCGWGAYLYWQGRVASPSCWREGRHRALTSPETLTHLPLTLCSDGERGLLTLGALPALLHITAPPTQLRVPPASVPAPCCPPTMPSSCKLLGAELCPSNSCVEVTTPSTTECDCLWR